MDDNFNNEQYQPQDYNPEQNTQQNYEPQQPAYEPQQQNYYDNSQQNGYNEQYQQYNQQNAYNQNQQYNQYSDQPQQYNAPYYNQQYPSYAEPVQEKKGFAIASLVLGIASLLLCCCTPYVTLPSSIVGLIMGIVSTSKKEGARGVAIAGIITSACAIVLSIVMLILTFSGIAEASSSDLYNDVYDEIYREFYNELY